MAIIDITTSNVSLTKYYLDQRGFHYSSFGNSIELYDVYSDPNTTVDLSSLYLTSIDNTTGDLWKLDCSNNSLTSISNLPYQYLNCEHNLLSYLPSLPHTLTYLNCRYNSLTTSSIDSIALQLSNNPTPNGSAWVDYNAENPSSTGIANFNFAINNWGWFISYGEELSSSSSSL